MPPVAQARVDGVALTHQLLTLRFECDGLEAGTIEGLQVSGRFRSGRGRFGSQRGKWLSVNCSGCNAFLRANPSFVRDLVQCGRETVKMPTRPTTVAEQHVAVMVGASAHLARQQGRRTRKAGVYGFVLDRHVAGRAVRAVGGHGQAVVPLQHKDARRAHFYHT